MSFLRTVPALPVQDIAAATAFYVERFGFTVVHSDAGFAKMTRDEAEVHLWASNDEAWRSRGDFLESPISSGAESFIAGTASCRIEVEDIDGLYDELAAAAVLHPTDGGSAVDTDWGTREFATLDLEGNLLTFFR